MSVILILIFISFFVVAAVICALLVRAYEKKTNAICKSKKRLDDKTVLVTGGTAGMGLEVASDLARRGARVIIACPFENEGLSAKKKIVEDTGNSEVIFKLLDLGSLNSVRKFVEDFLKTEQRLDILINNAGVLMPDDFQTDDGMCFVMQVNYFGPFLLTLLLLPLLKKTGTISEPTRIVNLSSVVHRFGTVDFDNLNKVGYWFKLRIYANSKLCIAMFTRELSKMLTNAKCSNVMVNTVDPGAVGTRIYDTCGQVLGIIIRMLLAILFKTPREGAQTTIYVAVDEKSGSYTGGFFKNCQLSKPSRKVYDDKICNRLFKESLRLVKLNN